MLGVFGDEHMRDRALGRQAALDQPGRRQGLGDALRTGPAGVFRAHRDDHPKLRRHDVQALRAVLADPDHLPAAAGADVFSGSITCSMRSRCSGRWPILRAA